MGGKGESEGRNEKSSVIATYTHIQSHCHRATYGAFIFSKADARTNLFISFFFLFVRHMVDNLA
jgi:hypothetical protein